MPCDAAIPPGWKATSSSARDAVFRDCCRNLTGDRDRRISEPPTSSTVASTIHRGASPVQVSSGEGRRKVAIREMADGQQRRRVPSGRNGDELFRRGQCSFGVARCEMTPAAAFEGKSRGRGTVQQR